MSWEVWGTFVAGDGRPARLNWSGSVERRILGAVDDDWLVGGSSRMLLRLSGQGRLVAGVKLVAGA